MTPAIVRALKQLAICCSTVKSTPQQGWGIDVWTLDSQAIAAAIAAYKVLIAPPTDELMSRLQRSGIDPNDLFYDEDNADDTTTRATIAEIIAAASLLSVDDAEASHMLLACVPSGSRKQSPSGIDILTVTMAHDNNEPILGPTDSLLVCSVKHSIVDVGDLRSKLVASISDTSLNPKYLAGQLRMLFHRLEERGITNAARVFLFLEMDPFLAPPHFRLIAAGAADATMSAALTRQMSNLPLSTPNLRHFRHILEGVMHFPPTAV